MLQTAPNREVVLNVHFRNSFPKLFNPTTSVVLTDAGLKRASAGLKRASAGLKRVSAGLKRASAGLKRVSAGLKRASAGLTNLFTMYCAHWVYMSMMLDRKGSGLSKTCPYSQSEHISSKCKHWQLP